MDNKLTMYAALSSVSGAWTQIDDWLAEHATETWQLIRTIDDWLVQYRADGRVGIEQYQRQCERLKACYELIPDQYAMDDESKEI